MTRLDLDRDGLTFVRGLLKPTRCAALKEDIVSHHQSSGARGIRHAERKLASIVPLFTELKKRLPPLINMRLVRTLVFIKSPAANWSVAWHQDKTVAVNKLFSATGWGPWSTKEHVYHVQPPVALLENMLALRVHLEQSDTANGCLRVIPGSHTQGVMSPAQLQYWRNTREPLDCVAQAGDVLLMRPLLLHASNKIRSGESRTIIHFELSSFKLPAGIVWAAEEA